MSKLKINKYFILSFVLALLSIILIVKWGGITSWLLFYLFVTIFIILLFKQIDEWGIVKDPHRNYECFSDNGIFKFSEEGFFINENKTQDFIKWTEIKQIISYNVTFYENPIAFIEIYIGPKNYKFNEETLGWYQLITQITTQLPNIDKSWTINNLTNPSDKSRIIYNQINQ